ncbi:hypothetical protein ORM92_23230 [Bacillus cereus]|uniref:hypothetical protein n=1 Tax=Bacillus cereus TaxID=1396 RepID=UPI002ABFCECE|nr:hypothetical protein [Bacillus cereus]MDZ4406756.1 hypothetical protein [Bacillus cereus]MDZ4533991.1 hypothetical protein [Bacillus cereus]
MELIEKEGIIYMQKWNYHMFQKPMKVLATSAIFTTTLFSPIMTNGLIVHAEIIAAQTTNSNKSIKFPLYGAFLEEVEAVRS